MSFSELTQIAQKENYAHCTKFYEKSFVHPIVVVVQDGCDGHTDHDCHATEGKDEADEIHCDPGPLSSK